MTTHVYPTIRSVDEKLDKIIELLEPETEGVLRFKLPEDHCAFKIASNAMSWALVPWDMQTELRGLLKYGQHGYDTKTLEYIQDFLFELLNRYIE